MFLLFIAHIFVYLFRAVEFVNKARFFLRPRGINMSALVITALVLQFLNYSITRNVLHIKFNSHTTTARTDGKIMPTILEGRYIEYGLPLKIT